MAAHTERFEQRHEDAPSLPSLQPFPSYEAEHPAIVPAQSSADLWRRLVRHWDIIAATVTFGLLGAGLYLQLTDKQYDASAYIVSSRSQLVTTLFQAGGQSADPERDVNTNLEVIASETIAARVRSQLNLRMDIPQLLAKVKVVTKGNSNVFTITARDPCRQGRRRSPTRSLPSTSVIRARRAAASSARVFARSSSAWRA